MSHQLVSFAGEQIEVYSIVDNNGQVWLLANPFAKILQYSSPHHGIRNISEQNVRDYEILRSELQIPTQIRIEETGQNRGNVLQSRSKFINRAGLFELIDKSRMPKAIEFKQWINNDLLPKVCKTIVDCVEIDAADEVSMQTDEPDQVCTANKMSNKIVSFAGEEIEVYSIVDNNGQVWLLANPFAKVLQYSSPNDIIRKHVSDRNVCEYNNFKSRQIVWTEVTGQSRGNMLQSRSKFINRAGLFELIDKSRMPKAIEFKQWINNDLLPKLCENATYNMETDAPIEQTSQMRAIKQLTTATENESMDITPQAHASLLQTVENMKLQLKVKDLEKNLEIQTLKHNYDKQMHKLHMSYMFQSDKAEKLSVLAIQEYASRTAKEKELEEITTTLTKDYFLTPRMDTRNPNKAHNIGFYYNKALQKYCVYRQQTGTMRSEFSWIVNSCDDLIPHPFESKLINPRRQQIKILQGEPIRVGHGVNEWNEFRAQHSNLMFGLWFESNQSTFVSFTLHDEQSLLMKYDDFLQLSNYTGTELNEYKDSLIGVYGLYATNFYEEIFEKMQFTSAEDCVERCLVRNIWQLRDALKNFIDSKSFENIRELAVQRGEIHRSESLCSFEQTRDSSVAAVSPLMLTHCPRLSKISQTVEALTSVASSPAATFITPFEDNAALESLAEIENLNLDTTLVLPQANMLSQFTENLHTKRQIDPNLSYKT